MSLYSNSTLSPTGNSLAQEVFPQNPLWCTASLLHAPLPIVALRFGHVKTLLMREIVEKFSRFLPFCANRWNVFGIIDSLTPVSVVKL